MILHSDNTPITSSSSRHTSPLVASIIVIVVLIIGILPVAG